MESSYFNKLEPKLEDKLNEVCKKFDKNFLSRLKEDGKKTKKTIASPKKKDKESASTYKSAINTLRNLLSKKQELPSFIRDFPEIIAVLCEYDEIDKAKEVAQIAYYQILSNNLQNHNHNTGTAIKDFVDFVNRKRKKAKSTSRITSFIKDIKDDIDKYYGEHVYYSNYVLIKTMESRLRRQDRVSGDKVWLPLGIIAKIFNPTQKATDTRFIEWINSIAVNIYIHYKNGNVVQSAKLSDVAALDFEKCGDDKKVYVILKKGGRFIALTPTGILNKKEEVLVKSIDGLVIDHIKPIDLTLRDLGNQNKLSNLKRIKEIMLMYPNDSNRTNNTLKYLVQKGVLTNTFKDDLIKELKAIRDDSPCRLMKADLNGTKSNMTEYKYILKVKNKKEYYGIVYGDEKKEICKDTSSNDYVICHKLDSSLISNDIMIYTMRDYKCLNLFPKEIKITRIDIDLI